MGYRIEWDGRVYDYDPKRMTVATAMVIKNNSGWGLKTWEKAVDEWDPLAAQLLLFAVKAQNGEPCDPNTLVDFPIVDWMQAFEVAALEWMAAQKPKAPKTGKGSGRATPARGTRKRTPTSPGTATGTSSSSPRSAG